MADILKEIIGEIKVDEKSAIFDKQINVNERTNNLLSNLDDENETLGRFRIKIFGIGGAGCNVIDYMISARTWANNVNLYALNTDYKALKRIQGLTNVYLLGKKALRGSGSGGDPIIGKLSVEESINDIHNVLENTDILFIIAGLGKGTGSGASPEIAKIARSLGILTVAIINFPSVNAEGRQVYENALNSFNILKNEVDAITKISNDKIILNDRSISFTLALEHANSEVTNVVGNIVNMIDSASNINLDFADVTNFFKNNKTFMSGNFELKENYSFDALKEIINHNIKASYCDMNLQTENCKLLMNLNINTNVPSSVTHDLRNIFKDITSDQSPSLIYGIDYTNVDGIKASFLMSANEQECIVNEIPSNALKHNENVSGDINEIFTNEAFINLDESMNEIENKTSGVKHENIKLATEEILIDEATSSNNRIDSLTTQVINDVLNPNNQTAKFTKKYN